MNALRNSARALGRPPVRGLAPKKGKKGAETAAEKPVNTGSMSAAEVTGCNIFKTGSDPTILPDDQYPEWLWGLTKPAATLNELRRQDQDSMTSSELQRLIKLERRALIKEHNSSRAKK
mmetsp:Transcript_13931/g.35065  ORF Transcript_13931/g.35065 Transcript_13931/m.35065 type:complete len:119 (+) Transcript_13931:320-676(+)